jgi:two-component system cell cycle response regulator DivK
MAQILVVDDHELSAKLLERVLSTAGYEVLAVRSLAGAERAIEEREPALVVLDRRLPDGDGLELARELKARPHSPPVLACTAGEPNNHGDHELQRSCDAYVAKPIEVDRFVEVVASLLSRS